MITDYVTSVDEGLQEQIATVWSGVYDVDLEGLAIVLAAAKTQCEQYQRADIPGENKFLAQVYQARALVRAGYSGTDGELYNGDAPTVTLFPMDWTVKNLLRPKRPLGGVA